MKRIPQNTCIYENIPHKEMPFSSRNKGRFHTTIKNSKPLEIKMRIIYLNSGTLELWKFSNLTFKWYLAGTTSAEVCSQPVKTNPTQPNPPSWVSFWSLVGWVELQKIFWQQVGLGLGHKISNPPNLTRPTHIYIYI